MAAPVTKRAKTLSPEQLDHLLRVIAARSRDPLRDYVAVLLSFKAGLRAAEIAGLSWADVTDAAGTIGVVHRNPVTQEPEHFITVPGGVKNGSPRAIPLHLSLKGALEALYASLPSDHRRPRDPVIRSLLVSRKYPRVSADALRVYLRQLFVQAGFQGCTSHSGRRTLLTALAQNAQQFGCSLKDVQAIAGHKYLETTEAYIDASPFVGRMMRAN